jgi:hypothetical protein
VSALLAFLAVAALLAPARDPEGARLLLDVPAAEAAWLAGALALAGLFGRRLPRLAAALLAGLLLALAAANLADAAAPVVLGRPVELWWDLRHAPSLWGMARDGFGPVRAAGAAAAIGAAGAALWALLAWLLARAPGPRLLNGACLAAALVLGVALPPRAAPALVAQGAVAWHAWEAAHGRDNPWTRAMRAKLPPHSDLAGLGGRDLHLVFIESYGAAALGDPTVEAALAGFGAALGRAGYHAVTHRLLSPTYGGSSWLAHGTLASGIRLTDQLAYRLLLESGRPTLPRLMKAAGYRAIEIVPGIKSADPDAAFWGWDRIWDAAALGYEGPPFGWFRIPDQATVKRVLAAETAAPLFAQWVLVSSHVPFVPVPPHVAWDDAGAYRSVDQATWDRIYAPPDWHRLDRPYVASLAYVFRTLEDLVAHLPRDAVLVLLGDHQPPAFVMPGQDWSVPVHVIAREDGLLAPFRRLGYVDGLRPGTAPPRPMEGFLADFLEAFDRTTRAASR